MDTERREFILKYLRNETRPDITINAFSLGRAEIFSLSIAAVLSIGIALLGLFGANVIYAYILIIMITVVLLVPLLIILYSEIRSFRSPTNMVLDSGNRRMERQDVAISELSKEKIADLTRVVDHLEYESLGLQFRTILIAGTIGKLGPIPAVLLIYTSYYLKLSELLPRAMMASAIILVIFTYIMSVAAMLVSERIRLMVYISKCAIRECEEKSTRCAAST